MSPGKRNVVRRFQNYKNTKDEVGMSQYRNLRNEVGRGCRKTRINSIEKKCKKIDIAFTTGKVNVLYAKIK